MFLNFEWLDFRFLLYDHLETRSAPISKKLVQSLNFIPNPNILVRSLDNDKGRDCSGLWTMIRKKLIEKQTFVQFSNAISLENRTSKIMTHSKVQILNGKKTFD